MMLLLIKNVITKIMNNSTGLQPIELNGFSKRHWQTAYYPLHMVAVRACAEA